MQPLSVELNRLILKHAPKYNVSSFVPDSYDLLMRNIGEMVVWDGASSNTIYADVNVNYAFRAWHDKLHIDLNADFSIEGESRVAMEQARLLKSDSLGRIIIVEVIDQAKYFNANGFFPVDQVDFVLKQLRK
jgi:hypothetical protein